MIPPTQPKHTLLSREKTGPLEERLWQALEEVEDPEFPLSVVDMGLIYGLEIEDRRVQVQLTFTAMGCPCMEFILSDIRQRLLQEPEIDTVNLEIVWDPPWTRQRLSPKGIEKLKGWGVTV